MVRWLLRLLFGGKPKQELKAPGFDVMGAQCLACNNEFYVRYGSREFDPSFCCYCGIELVEKASNEKY